jgi:hypothetical protein
VKRANPSLMVALIDLREWTMMPDYYLVDFADARDADEAQALDDERRGWAAASASGSRRPSLAASGQRGWSTSTSGRHGVDSKAGPELYGAPALIRARAYSSTTTTCKPASLAHRPLDGLFAALAGRLMHHPVRELRRMTLLGRWVNRGS